VTGQITTASRNDDDIQSAHLDLSLGDDDNGQYGGNGNGQQMADETSTASGTEKAAVLEYATATHNGTAEEDNELRLQIRNARLKGFEGDMCMECGSFTMVRNGTCLKCTTCGATSGCS